MGVLGYDSRKTDQSQNYLDYRAAATEGSLIGYGAQATTAGGSVLRSEAGSSLAFTPTSTEIYNDPEIAKVAIKQQKKLADSFLEAFQKKEDTLQSILAANAELAANAQTGGEAGRNKTMMIVTLAVLVLVGWIFWKG